MWNGYENDSNSKKKWSNFLLSSVPAPLQIKIINNSQLFSKLLLCIVVLRLDEAVRIYTNTKYYFLS